MQANSVSQLKYTHYGLKYILNGDLIEIEIINRAVIIHKNDVLLDKGNYALPKKVLAVAFMLNDKFHFKQNTALNENNIYEYLGVRVTSNASWTSSIGNKIAECLVNLASNERLQDFIERLSKYLELDSKLSIGCEISASDFWHDDLKTYLIKCGQKITDQEEFRRDAVKRISEDDYEILAEYLSEIRKNNLYIQEGNKIQFGVVFSTDNTRDEILKVKNDYKLIRDLCNLKVIKNLSLYLYLRV